MTALLKNNLLFTNEAALFLSRYKPRTVNGNTTGNKNTFEAYKRALNRFYVWIIGSGIQNINEIKLPELSLFQDDLLHSYSPKTTQVYCSIIKEFFTFLNNRGVLKSNEFATLKIITIDKRDSSAITLNESELKKVLKYVRNLDNSPSNIVNKMIVLILANSGLRESELCQLKIGDVVLQGKNLVLQVQGKGMRKRFVVLSPQVSQEIIKLRNTLENSLMSALGDSDYLIQSMSNSSKRRNADPIDRSNIIRRINNIGEDCGVKFTPHSLRRTFATTLYKNDTPIEAIQRILGHESVTTTQSYIHMDVDKEVGIKYSTNW
jgi:site-specific recombinase XerD